MEEQSNNDGGGFSDAKVDLGGRHLDFPSMVQHSSLDERKTTT
jgi:hypothetical protein